MIDPHVFMMAIASVELKIKNFPCFILRHSLYASFPNTMNKNNALYDNIAFFLKLPWGSQPTPCPRVLWETQAHATNLTTGRFALIHIMGPLPMAFTATAILGSQGFGDDFTCISCLLVRGHEGHLHLSHLLLSVLQAPEVSVWQSST